MEGHGVVGFSEGLLAGFASPYTNHLLKIANENLAITDLSGIGRLDDALDGLIKQRITDRNLNFDLGQEVHNVLCATVKFGVALLSPKPLHFSHRDASDSKLRERFANVIKFERFDYGSDQFDVSSRKRWQWRGLDIKSRNSSTLNNRCSLVLGGCLTLTLPFAEKGVFSLVDA